MQEKDFLRLGVIGMSEGNGHPYSWAAIFNGFDPEGMKSCPFPAIPQYLSERKYPEDFIPNARVTHVWTQERSISESIATASKIEHVCDDFREMSGEVDGVLLARDDAENHFEFAPYFLEKGIPVFIDKPIAHTVENARKLFEMEQYEGQLYTCSALRYADEMFLTLKEKEAIGEMTFIDAITPKYWENYAVHVIEAVVAQLGPVKIEKSENVRIGNQVTLVAELSNGITFRVAALGKSIHPMTLTFCGKNGFTNKKFTDSFTAFRGSLRAFVQGVRERRRMIDINETYSIISLIESGIKE